jgi:hypothetical protein
MSPVNIPWSPKANNITTWNEITASIIEHFGLPGDRYTTEVNIENMSFFFKDDRDALMCRLLVSDNI